ncbi:MAG: flagellar basal-body MS-ring/collar protein FliF [Candidatus Margulisiibacteriota bacterium]
MAEPAGGGGGFDLRRLLLIGGVVAVVLFSALFFFFRSCAPAISAANKKPGYTVIYSNLDLKDAANVIARLKETNLQYEIRDDGRAIAVPKEKADQARLSLAEKNLPVGGVVGWEIFDESKLGATDFDRRIQLIRAISGELSRMIRRINGVEEATVQVVIPESKLFAATTAPVTAAVMLRLRPGFMLAPEKINGIVHLVASSVENLQVENVTVVDDTGRILTGKLMFLTAKQALTPPPPAEQPVEIKEPEVSSSPELIITKPLPVLTTEAIARPAATKEVAASPEAAARPVLTGTATLTAAEKVRLKVQSRRELEQELAGKAQELLNRFYPLNSVIVKVTVDVKPAKEVELKARDLKIKKVSTIVLIDNRVDFNANLKKATLTTVAAAVSYNKKRGDRILLQRVPFHLASPPLITVKGPAKGPGAAGSGSLKIWGTLLTARRLAWAGVAFALLVGGFWFISSRRKGTATAAAPAAETAAPVNPGLARESVSKLDQVRNIAEQNPERIAELLKKWLSE